MGRKQKIALGAIFCFITHIHNNIVKILPKNNNKYILIYGG